MQLQPCSGKDRVDHSWSSLPEPGVQRPDLLTSTAAIHRAPFGLDRRRQPAGLKRGTASRPNLG